MSQVTPNRLSTASQSPLKLAVTGGIGSGKSYVCELLTTHFGIPVYNCDAEAKRLNVESNEIRQKLIALVGKEVYAPNGELQRKVLADYLFKSEENAQRINAITHPVVADDFRQWTQKQKEKGHKLVAMECAILFESGFDKLANVVLNVNAPVELCIERATRRDNANAEAIKRRIALQMSNEERNMRADFTIVNDGNELIPQLQTIVNKLKVEN